MKTQNERTREAAALRAETAVHAGLSLLAIAKNTGTSVTMIERHYGHFTPDNMRQLMDMVELG